MKTIPAKTRLSSDQRIILCNVLKKEEKIGNNVSKYSRLLRAFTFLYKSRLPFASSFYLMFLFFVIRFSGRLQARHWFAFANESLYIFQQSSSLGLLLRVDICRLPIWKDRPCIHHTSCPHCLKQQRQPFPPAQMVGRTEKIVCRILRVPA